MHALATRDWLAARTAASPSALALIEGECHWTYAELDRLVDAIGRHLLSEGVRPGSHVAVLLPNCLAYVGLIHAIRRIDAVLVPLNVRLTPGELADQVSRADCSHLVTTAGLAQSKVSEITAPTNVIVMQERPPLPEDAPLPSLPQRALDKLGDLQAIVFTSGTTGSPKGAMLTCENQFYSAMASAYRLGVLPNDRWLACLPLYHVGGLAIVLRACLYGTVVVLISDNDTESILDAIARHQVTLVSLVPTMLTRLLVSPAREILSQLRLVLLGGAEVSANLMAAATAAGVPAATTYGLTEACSQVATMLPPDAEAKPGSVGRPLLFTSVSIKGEHGDSLPAGEIGEICVRGPGVFAGYYKDPAATAAVLRGGELHTGDMGYLDRDGDLWVVQRRSDLIVTGGENVYPAEVERVLRRFPGVSDVCVVGLPDAEWGQRVGALITLSNPVPVEELLAFVRANLAGYKVPRLIDFVDNLPMTGSGKVSRPAVIDRLRALETVSR